MDAERCLETFEKIMLEKLNSSVKEIYLFLHKRYVRLLLEKNGVSFSRGYLHRLLDKWFYENGYIDTKTYDELLEKLFTLLVDCTADRNGTKTA